MQLELALAIVLEGLAAPMSGVTVGLDDQPLRPPEEVDGEATDSDVHLGLREAMTAAEPQEGSLELAAELNGRPRKTLGWMTPAEKMDELLR